MIKTSDVAMIASRVFGIPDSHVMEIIRRIREQDLYVRETRALRNRPQATARHIANLSVALLAGASSRMAPDTIVKMESCVAESHYFQKSFRTREPQVPSEFLKYFSDAAWSGYEASFSSAPIRRAPFAAIHDAALDDRRFNKFSIVDLFETLLAGLANYPEVYPKLAASEIRYDPDRNTAAVFFLDSEFEPASNSYTWKESDLGGPTEFEIRFQDDDNDFQGSIQRSVTLSFDALLSFSKALRRGES